MSDYGHARRAPDIVHRIVAALKKDHPRYCEMAEAQQGLGLVSVAFEAEDQLVIAYYNKEARAFVRLLVSPKDDPPPGEPGVVYDITPPESGSWWP